MRDGDDDDFTMFANPALSHTIAHSISTLLSRNRQHNNSRPCSSLHLITTNMRYTTRLTIQWVFFFCFLSRCSAETSQASSSEGHSVRGRPSRWERLDAPISSSVSKDGASNGPSSISAMAAGRRACGLYVWDAPSALLHKWCTHLLRDCIYEGRGGHKVRDYNTYIFILLQTHARHTLTRFAAHVPSLPELNLARSFNSCILVIATVQIVAYYAAATFRITSHFGGRSTSIHHTTTSWEIHLPKESLFPSRKKKSLPSLIVGANTTHHLSDSILLDPDISIIDVT
jgi:hypothetical protein